VRGLHRYIISNTQAAHHVLEVNFALHILDLDALDLDIVPLFETIDDLKRSESVMQRLYESPFYRERLKRQGNRQVVMVGFSDGTKDGGYLSCNWEIFKAKRGLEALSDRYGVEILFFDGRGGPPARGGGNTHRFYRALGANLKQQEVQLTIQGQTISSMYGTEEAARFNLEQLYTAGLEAKLHPDPKGRFTAEETTLIDALSEKSLAVYGELRSDPHFLTFLQEKTPLEYYGKLNVASRPAKRGKSAKLQLKDLRAIPFVGAWSQIRLNVPGYYGLGTALEWGYAQGKGAELEKLYRDNLFFRTLIDNCMQALAKSSALSTRYLLKEPTYGSFVERLLQEMERTRAYVLKVSGQKTVLESDPINKESIELREKLILPLLVIQQYALEKSGDASYERLLLKTVPALINATRNSA
ncbi:MAG: phosphoenolpyruvate carboxylase, partial [Chlamydiia bacterium]|nr:phosphoenolpyruvate carboxylase [Chlamydiia bacterium]